MVFRTRKRIVDRFKCCARLRDDHANAPGATSRGSMTGFPGEAQEWAFNI